MKPTVHILASVLHPSVIKSTLLVFKSIRVGFPTAELIVHGHDLDYGSTFEVKAATAMAGGTFIHSPATTHGKWIERLIENSRDALWICDTDMVFFDKVEDFTFGNQLYAGRIEPAHNHPLVPPAASVERLHPSLMWFDPNPLRAAIRGWPGCHSLFRYFEINLIRWSLIPRLNKPSLLYDTCAGLWQALTEKGWAFTPQQNAAFEHLFHGTYRHKLPGARGEAILHDAVWSNPEMAHGLYQRQMQWYAEHPATL